jgi:lipoate-protein ligase B
MLNDTLLLLEHPPVYTLGRNAQDSNILASREFLEKIGIEVYRVERGGDVTYHGPRQLVGYPILDLHNFRQDVGWFVRSMEEMLIRVLADFGIQGRRIEKLVGVWVDNPASGGNGAIQPDAKIVQIGARIENWITYHGFALNVDPNMAHFDMIVPCGISDKAVTSMARVLQHPVDMGAVREGVALHFAAVFGAETVRVTAEEFYAALQEAEQPSPT